MTADPRPGSPCGCPPGSGQTAPWRAGALTPLAIAMSLAGMGVGAIRPAGSCGAELAVEHLPVVHNVLPGGAEVVVGPCSYWSPGDGSLIPMGSSAA